MRYLLDTNIIGNVTKPEPSPSLLEWMAAQADEDLFIASLTIAEIWRGILEQPAGKPRNQLEAWFAGSDGPKATSLAGSCHSTAMPHRSGLI